jgi:nucleotide-binding universal stress UspA family protein
VIFGRRRFDPQPTAPVAVLLASSGAPFTRDAVRRARALARGEPVAVLTILRVYGSQFGLPSPGLLPTRSEREEQLKIVNRAVAALERADIDVDGQVAITRSAAKTIARVARTRGARVVVMDDSQSVGWRRRVEGDLTNIVRRRLPPGVTLEIVPAAAQKG